MKVSTQRRIIQSKGIEPGLQSRDGLGEHPKSVDLADIVNQSEPRTRPLYIHFMFGSQSEAMHLLLDTDICKDRLDNTQTKGQVEYEPLSVPGYEKRYRDQQIKYLEKRAAKFDFQLATVPT